MNLILYGHCQLKDGSIYVFGGLNTKDKQIMGHTLEISPNLHVTEKNSMINPRLFPACLVLKDRYIFVVSGTINYQKKFGTASHCSKDQDPNMCDCYDVQENEWFSI